MQDITDNQHDLSARIKFSDVALRMEKIRRANTPDDKTKELRRFIVSFRQFRDKFISEEGSAARASFYPVLRLFLPKADTERNSYGIQTKMLGKLYVKALAIDQQSEAGVKLTVRDGATSGDYADVVFDVMKERSPEKGTLTVFEVNKCLDLISDHFRNNERKKVDTEIALALRGMTSLDCKWFTRIILKKLSMGLGFERILHIYHPHAVEYYNQLSHLSHVCDQIDFGNAILQQNQSHIELFKPIRPMLCERGLISQIKRTLGEDDYYVETKMDGERCHIHIDGNKFKYFSRNCKDECTNVFGSDCSVGLFSPVLHRLLNSKIRNAIFDGEMMVWNRERNVYVTKAENAAARNLRPDDPHLNPCFCIYDILYLDDEPLMSKPYADRSRLLQRLVTETRGYLTLCNRVKIETADQFLECVNKAFDAKEEGVVIKRASSTYRPGQREKGGWIKIKPDYENKLISDFDLLIVGGYYNSTRTAVNNFLLGVYNKNSNDDGNGVFYAVTSVINGLSDQQLKSIQAKLEPYWNKVQSSKIGRSTISVSPECIEWNNAVPDAWIEPKKSIILQIKGSELVETKTFRTSHSFRFPRVMAVREDKIWSDCCTLSEFEKFCSTNSKVEKLTKRHATIEDMNESRPLPKRKKQIKSNVLVPEELLNEKVDNVCDGLDFCILNSGKNKSSYEEPKLKAIIAKHGGRVVANPSSNTFVCIAGYESFKVENAISCGKYNIATIDWLLKSFGGENPLQLLPKFQPLEMIYATPDLQLKFKDFFDIHGDSYSEETSKNDFKQLFANMKIDLLPVYTKSELYDLEADLWRPEEPPNFFRSFTALFLPLKNINGESAGLHEYHLAQFLFKTKAGRIVQHPAEDNEDWSKLTHIFIYENNFDSTQIPWRKNDITTKIVSSKWILECYNANGKISDDGFVYSNK